MAIPTSLDSCLPSGPSQHTKQNQHTYIDWILGIASNRSGGAAQLPFRWDAVFAIYLGLCWTGPFVYPDPCFPSVRYLLFKVRGSSFYEPRTEFTAPSQTVAIPFPLHTFGVRDEPLAHRLSNEAVRESLDDGSPQKTKTLV